MSNQAWRPLWGVWLLCLCGVLWAFGALVQGALSPAPDPIRERAVWTDTSGQVGWEEARDAPYHLLGESTLTRLGYGDSVHWFRLRIDAPGPWILRIQPLYLDEVRLFEQTPTGWSSRVAGDHHPYQARERDDVAFSFEVSPNEVNQGLFWLRLRTTSSSIIDIEALSLREANQKALAFERFMAINLGLVGGVLIWALFQFIATRDPLIFKCIVYECFTLLMVLAMSGRLSDSLFPLTPAWADTVMNFLILSGTAVLAWFHRHYLTPYGLGQRAQRFLRLVPWLLPLELVALAFGPVHWVMQFNATVALLCFAVFAWAAWRIDHPDGVYATMVRGVYLILGLLLVPLVGSLFGWEIPTQPALYGVTLHGAFAAVLMLLLLNMRQRQEQQVGEQLRQQTALALQQAHQAQTQSAEQEQLLAMLAHEIKNPLAVVTMVMGAQDKSPRMVEQASQAIQEVTAIIDQALMLDQITRERPEQAEPLDLTELLADLTETWLELTDRLHTHGLGEALMRADPLWCKIVAQNLLSNALRYSPPGSIIDCSLQRSPQQWRLVISNLGWPDARPDPQRLFEKFYRGPANLRVSGTGLGLFVSRHLARRMGGDLLYEPTQDRIRFVWLIPV